ncbi:uncharacterized protein At3g28850-like [Papaver somniferum]|uniref:uncharacterized protein At3g28850-like n=1 Tax=Papaver somniferum TaxID=3469 RepID=UPI000E6FA3AE|nr:uncharacterized protein At3g28850-like [Papaver somniferum]
MGCSVSRPDQTLISSTSNNNIETFSSPSVQKFSKNQSFCIVHHPPLKKGDTHHLVSLTSTTYGSLLLIDSNPSSPISSPKSPSPSSSPDSVINTWELMDGLDDYDYSVPKKPVLLDRSYSWNSSKKSCFEKQGPLRNGLVKGNVMKLCSAFEEAKISRQNSRKENESARPLWKHLSEESLLADMDPNVATSFRRAVSSRHLGGFHSSKSMVVKPNTTTSSSSSSLSRFSTFMDEKVRLKEAEDRIVIYYTSLRGIRRTFEDCCTVRSIFRGFRVSIDERDISMDSAYRKELQTALGEKTVSLPRVFIKGKYLGGVEEVKQLHEIGELVKLLGGIPAKDPNLVCSCGDLRFLPCSNCQGSRKILSEDDEQLRRCPDCNENGLIRCPDCCN